MKPAEGATRRSTGGSLGASAVARVEAAADALTALCAELVRIPSPNPPGDTRAIAAFVAGQLSSVGLRPTVYSPDRQKPNVLVQIGEGRGPNIVLNGHLDTFPPAEGDPTPFAGIVAERRVYGCGVSDMKAGVAVMLSLAAAFAPFARDLEGTLMLTFVSDEETGGSLGSQWLLDNVDGVRGADFCYDLDQSGLDRLSVGEKGAVWLRVATIGRGGHSAYDESASAIDHLLEVLGAVAQFRGRHAPAGLPDVEQSPEAKVTSVNIGRIEGGVSPNLIAASAAAEVDLRLPVGMGTDSAIAEVERILEATGIQTRREILLLSEPTLSDPGNRFVSALHRQAESELGQPVSLAVRPGASDARLFRRAGISSTVYGPKPHGMGSASEHVEVAELHAVSRIYARTLAELLLS